MEETEAAFRYFIKRPSGRRKNFDLICYIPIDRRTKKYQDLPKPLKSQVSKINAQFFSKVLSASEVETLLNAIIQKQYAKFKIKSRALTEMKLSTINQKIFDGFWVKMYEDRRIVDKASAKYDFERALALVDPLSLMTSTSSEITRKLDSSGKTAAQIRRAVDRLNQILAYLGRDFTLQKPEEELVAVSYVTKAELDQILVHVKDQVIDGQFYKAEVFTDLIVTLFCAGLRISESMALTSADYRNGAINVDKQFTRYKKLKKPKRGKQGRVFVFNFGEASVRRWTETNPKDAYRYPLTKALHDACKLAFPNDQSKWLSPHDLRHSYAIHLLGQGASLTQVALNLRNRIEVCQKYYTGFANTEDTLDALKNLFKEKEAPNGRA